MVWLICFFKTHPNVLWGSFLCIFIVFITYFYFIIRYFLNVSLHRFVLQFPINISELKQIRHLVFTDCPCLSLTELSALAYVCQMLMLFIFPVTSFSPLHTQSKSILQISAQRPPSPWNLTCYLQRQGGFIMKFTTSVGTIYFISIQFNMIQFNPIQKMIRM